MTEIVQCRSDSQYADRPLSFIWQGEWLDITYIYKRWRTPQGFGFLVQVHSGASFELFYDQDGDHWSIEQKSHTKEFAFQNSPQKEQM